MSDRRGRQAALLRQLRAFVADERQATFDRLETLWSKPMTEKLTKGISQRFVRLERRDHETLWAHVDAADSRFREGDLLRLHGGDPHEPIASQVTLEAEQDDRWLLRRGRERQAPSAFAASTGECFADPDALDLSPYYDKAFDDIASSRKGQEILLPLLAGDLEPAIEGRSLGAGIKAALAAGLNQAQAQAVGFALGAQPVACIQGPPGTGKTRVLALAARLMVARGERVLLTAPTHTAINHALDRVRVEGAPVAKVGAPAQGKGLTSEVPRCEKFTDWTERPAAGGYVIGATPFSTVSGRLEGCEFDTVLFDEASQLTVSLALMAMRTGARFVFIGDQRQLPPVVLSRSVLDQGGGCSVFAALTDQSAHHSVMLEETYRMNRWLTAWPSRQFYDGKLEAAGRNRERRLAIAPGHPRLDDILQGECTAFVPSRDPQARSQNRWEAELVRDLCVALDAGGVPLAEIGVVTPYRAQGRLVRTLLREQFGREAAAAVVADTVERMQGQEREVVILSLATADPAFLATVGEFFFRPERLNVAITRAKTKLIVIGPDQERLPAADHPELARWMALYRDFIAACRRVTL